MSKYDLTLYHHLKKEVNPCRLTTSQDETMIRCPFCGDSKKSKSSTHLYIQNKTPFKYFCQRCNASGVMNNKVLSMLNSGNIEINSYINNQYNEYISNMNKKYGKSFINRNTKELNYYPNKYTDLEISKINYINERLGINIDEKDIELYKIILNIEDFYKNNEFDIDNQYQINNLNNNYFSYMLNDKNTINCRLMNNNTFGTNGKKHFKQKIFKNLADESTRFYSIKNELRLDRRVYNIHIAEGFFDILGIFNHVYNKEINDNDIFIANNGKGYKFVLNYLNSLGILNMNINIYSDRDVKITDYRSKRMLGNSLPVILNDANIYYNEFKDEKDFGVSKDKIKLSEPIKFNQ
ncbi:hypothetical protein [Staphylococcus phage LY01]|nr:hypothetical protein [Staphylococcus phage LY01]